MKGFSFIHLVQSPEDPNIVVPQASGVILDVRSDGTMLVRLDLGKRTHMRLLPVAEALQWTLFESPKALAAFMKDMEPTKLEAPQKPVKPAKPPAVTAVK